MSDVTDKATRSQALPVPVTPVTPGQDGRVPQRIHVAAASASYDVIVGRGLAARAADFAGAALPKHDSTALLVTDANVAEPWAEVVADSFDAAGWDVTAVKLPAGESTKCMRSYAGLLGSCADAGLTRSSAVIAVGGGVIGDLSGFTAATYMRGCNLVQVATSLLAMVDSSVGGKTAIDLPQGKNLVGAFWQPSVVICDLDCLGTLSDEYLADGMGEVLKYGVMCDPELMGWLESAPLAGQEERVVARCIGIKRDVVEADERESGMRKLLNLGHTPAHSIELLSEYTIAHGHAVAAGLAIMARACAAKGWCDPSVPERVEAALRLHDLPTGCAYDARDLWEAARRDKKREGDHIDVVIIRAIGTCEVKHLAFDELLELFELGCAKADVVLAAPSPTLMEGSVSAC